MAAHGLELFKLQLLARWSSDVILRYVRESPLKTLTSDYLRKQGANSVDEILAAMQSQSEEVKKRLESLDTRTMDMIKQEVSLRARQVASDPPKTFSANSLEDYENKTLNLVENLKTGAVHRVLTGSAEISPMLWSTVCGWKFGKSPTDRPSNLPASWRSICEKCLPTERAEARVVSGGMSD